MSEPQEVNRVTVTYDDLPMLVPTYIDQFGESEDKALASEMLRITREVRVLLGQLFLYIAMSRSSEFGAACNASEAKGGRRVILGGLLKSMIVCSAALFDEDPRTSNISKLLRNALSPDRSAFLNRFHENYGVAPIAQDSSRLLVKYGRKLKRGKLRDAIQAMVDLRNTSIAHFDSQPNSKNRALVRDLDYVISAASIVVGEANVYVLGRRIDFGGLRRILRKEANGFVDTLRRGLSL
jgi:hypothetical protein